MSDLIERAKKEAAFAPANGTVRDLYFEMIKELERQQYNVEGLARADAKVRELDGDLNIMRLQRDAAARLVCDAERHLAELEDSVYQYGIENTKLQLRIEQLEAEIEGMYEDLAGEDI